MLSWEYPPHIEGGLGRHVAELAPALVQQGVEVHVVTPADGPISYTLRDGLDWTSRHHDEHVLAGQAIASTGHVLPRFIQKRVHDRPAVLWRLALSARLSGF